MTRLTDSLKEPGLALVTALLVVVLVGALILGVFTTSVADYRISRNLLFQEQALAAAEYGQNDVLRSWDTSWVHTMQPGNVTVRPVTVLGGGLDSVRVTRLDNTTFWLVSTSTVGSGIQTQARRRTGVIVRLNTPYIAVKGAVTLRLTTSFKQGGQAYASGFDQNPPGWAGCGPTGPPVAGLAAPDTNSQNYTGGSQNSDSGVPPILETQVAADTATYSKFGGVTYQQLTAMANLVYTGGNTNAAPDPTANLGGTCDRANTQNWGEPERPPYSDAQHPLTPACYDYFPIIWVKGDLHLSTGGSRGQGILLVDGDFAASGGAEFRGLVIVRKTFQTSGSGIKVFGALFVNDSSTANNASNQLGGQSIIQYSSCTLAAVLLSTLSPYAKPVMQRSWADMF